MAAGHFADRSASLSAGPCKNRQSRLSSALSGSLTSTGQNASQFWQIPRPDPQGDKLPSSIISRAPVPDATSARRASARRASANKTRQCRADADPFHPCLGQLRQVKNRPRHSHPNIDRFCHVAADRFYRLKIVQPQRIEHIRTRSFKGLQPAYGIAQIRSSPEKIFSARRGPHRPHQYAQPPDQTNK